MAEQRKYPLWCRVPVIASERNIGADVRSAEGLSLYMLSVATKQAAAAYTAEALPAGAAAEVSTVHAAQQQGVKAASYPHTAATPSLSASMGLQESMSPAAAPAVALAPSVRASHEGTGAEPATAPIFSQGAQADTIHAVLAVLNLAAAGGAGPAPPAAVALVAMRRAAQAARDTCGHALPKIPERTPESSEGPPQDGACQFQMLSAAELVKLRAGKRKGSRAQLLERMKMRKKSRMGEDHAAPLQPVAAHQQRSGGQEAGEGSHPARAPTGSMAMPAPLGRPPSPEQRGVPKMPGSAPAHAEQAGEAPKAEGRPPPSQRQKKAGLVMYEGGCGLVRAPVPDQAELQAAADALVRATPGVAITHKPGAWPSVTTDVCPALTSPCSCLLKLVLVHERVLACGGC